MKVVVDYHLLFTFHFHYGLIRNILVASGRLGGNSLLVSLVARDDHYSPALESLKGAGLALLGARVNVRLENWEKLMGAHH